MTLTDTLVPKAWLCLWLCFSILQVWAMTPLEISCKNSQTYGTSATIHDIIPWQGRYVIAAETRENPPRNALYVSQSGFQWGEPVLLMESSAGPIEFSYNDRVLLARGSDFFLRSTDGISWTELETLPVFDDLFWAGSQFVARANQTIWHGDPEGRHWQEVATLPPSAKPEAMTWNGNRYVIVGSERSFFYSDDSLTWFAADPGVQEHRRPGKVVWNGDYFLTLAGYRDCFISHDGATWTFHKGTMYQHEHANFDFTWDGSVWVDISYGTVYTSQDGISWHKERFFGAFNNLDESRLRRRGNALWLVGEDGQIYTSSDRRHWIAYAPPLQHVIQLGTYHGWTYVGSEKMLYRTQDGLAWEFLLAGAGRIADLEIQGDRMMALDIYGRLYHGTVGDLLQPMNTTRPYTAIDRIFGAKGHWWVIAKNTVYQISPDLTWHQLDRPGKNMFAYGEGLILINQDQTFYSEEGLNWQEIPHHGTPGGGVIRNDKGFISLDGTRYSRNGYDWFPSNPKPPHSDYKMRAWGDTWTHCTEDWPPMYISFNSRQWREMVFQGLAPEASPNRGLYEVGTKTLTLLEETSTPTTDVRHYALSDCERPSTEQPNQTLIPWVTHNEQWSSRIAIFNPDPRGREVTLTALKGEETQQTKLWLTPQSLTVREADQLFGNLSAYALLVDHQDLNLIVSFLTFNKEAVSGGNAPSQSIGRASDQWATKLKFNYLPHDRTTYLVLCAPEAEPGEITRIELTVIPDEGSDPEIHRILLPGNAPKTLKGRLLRHPFAAKVTSAVAKSTTGQLIVGATFYFDEFRQPAMIAAIPMEPTP